MLLDSRFVRLPCYDKWEDITGIHYTDKDWECFNLAANKCTPSIDLRWFQYRIIHRILPTKRFLFKIKYTDSPKCSFCNTFDETIYHIFWECSKVENIWRELKTWLGTVDVKLNFTVSQVLFGVKGKNNYALNAMVILVKKIIYICSQNGFIPTTAYIKKQIINYYNITKYVYINLGQEAYFLKLWSSLHLLLRE